MGVVRKIRINAKRREMGRRIRNGNPGWEGVWRIPGDVPDELQAGTLRFRLEDLDSGVSFYLGL